MGILADDFGFWEKLAIGVVSAIAGSVGTVVVWWYSRKRPNRIEVFHGNELSLLNVADSIRPKIETTFAGEKVNALTQMEFEIRNRGSETIKNIELLFNLPELTTILGTEPSDLDRRNNSVVVRLPFLNSFREHKAITTVKIVCDGKIDGTTITGGGEGWSIYAKSKRGAWRERRALLQKTLLVAPLACMVIGLILLAAESTRPFSTYFILSGLAVFMLLFVTFVISEISTTTT